jgi:NTE family protein
MDGKLMVIKLFASNYARDLIYIISMNNLEVLKKFNTDNNSSKKETLENVLILQGGGSLGAFGCGVYKSLVKNNIDLDIIAGTSIGGINAAIIAGSKNNEHTDELLEGFWLELADGFVDIDNLSFFSSWNKFMEQIQPFSAYSYYPFLLTLSTAEAGIKENYSSNKTEMEVKIKQIKSFYSSAIFGNSRSLA